VLIISSNYLLRVDRFMMLVSSITIALMCFGITSLSIGCGAAYPRFDVENKAQIPTGFGGLIYMILAILFIGVVIVLEAGPVYTVLMAQLRSSSLQTPQLVRIYIAFATVLVINALVFYVPMKIGIRKLSELEKF
jgi:ABC-2 type transport system permease protein